MSYSIMPSVECSASSGTAMLLPQSHSCRSTAVRCHERRCVTPSSDFLNCSAGNIFSAKSNQAETNTQYRAARPLCLCVFVVTSLFDLRQSLTGSGNGPCTADDAGGCFFFHHDTRDIERTILHK